ncbi:biliverdin-producing heme oxygenase [Brachybacterium sp. AOP43-C2-M15]|uniref:biliverdin-producing heme oxygenase n=1 Tax=Brachybacterium sp. AOP43-C2-M15 TaxID=3457661 RepID=UPI0040338BDF
MAIAITPTHDSTDDSAVPDAPARFSALLREATRTEHSEAESRGFITRLMGGELTEEDYWRLLAQYLPVYEALEQAIEAAAASDALAASFHDPRLARAAAIRHDLAARFGEGPEIDAPLPITERYARRIREATVPQLLAHHYLRYLGDLSGGQAIGALVARHYQVPREQLTMWDFSGIDAPKRVKDGYREQLDGITDPAVREEFLAETKLGYELAGELFAALDR